MGDLFPAGSAVLSDDGRYRYSLTRTLELRDVPTWILWVM